MSAASLAYASSRTASSAPVTTRASPVVPSWRAIARAVMRRSAPRCARLDRTDAEDRAVSANPTHSRSARDRARRRRQRWRRSSSWVVPLSPELRCATARTRRPARRGWRTTDSACSWSTPGSAGRQRGGIVSRYRACIGIPAHSRSRRRSRDWTQTVRFDQHHPLESPCTKPSRSALAAARSPVACAALPRYGSAWTRARGGPRGASVVWQRIPVRLRCCSVARHPQAVLGECAGLVET